MVVARAGDARPPPTADDVERAQVSAAYRVEELVRAWSGGTHHTGVIMSRRALVTNASWANAVAEIWDAAPRSAATQPVVDRALMHLSRAFDDGLRCFEWDRPGYDEVTRSFTALLSRAARLDDDAVERIPFLPDAWDSPYARAAARAAQALPSSRGDPQRVAIGLGVVAVLIAVAVILALVATPSVRRGATRAVDVRAPTQPMTCDDALGVARGHLAKLRARAGATPEDPGRAAAIDETVRSLDERRWADARQAFAAVQHGEDLDALIVGPYLFLVEAECGRATR